MNFKLLLILTILLIFSGCFKKLPKKKVETTNPEEVEVPIPVFERPDLSDDDRQRIQENSFSIRTNKNITSVGPSPKNYITLNVVPAQDVTYRIIDDSDQIGTIEKDTNDIQGSYFVPGESSGIVEIQASNGVFQTSISIQILGPLVANTFKITSQDGGGNFVELSTTGGIGKVKYQLINNDFGRIEENKFYPIDFATFYSRYRSLGLNKDHVVLNYKATDENDNIAFGKILLFPKMILSFYDNKEKEINKEKLELLCSSDLQTNLDVKKIYVSIFGGIRPLNILKNHRYDLGVINLGFQNMRSNFELTTPKVCESEQGSFIVQDNQNNEARFNINFYENLNVSQNITETNNTSDSTLNFVDSQSVVTNTGAVGINRAQKESLLLSITGGRAPYRISNNTLELSEIDKNTYKISGLSAEEKNVSFKVFDSFGESKDVFLSQKLGIVTTIYNNALNSASLLSFLKVSPSTSAISILNNELENAENDYFFKVNNGLSFYEGSRQSEYTNFEKALNVSSFFAFSVGDKKDQIYVEKPTYSKILNFKVKDDLGVEYVFSKDLYQSFTFFKEDKNQFRKLDDSNCLNCTNLVFSLDLNEDFKRSFSFYFRNPKKYYPFDNNAFPIGLEQFSTFRLTGGINAHKVTQTVQKINLPLSQNTDMVIVNKFEDKKSCENNNENYGNIASIVNDSTNIERFGNKLDFKFDFSSFFKLSMGKDKFNNYLRTGTNQWNLLFKHKIHDSSADPSQFLFPIDDQYLKKYYSDVLESRVKIGSSFEYRKRPISLPTNAFNIKNVGRLFAYQIMNGNQSRICLKYVEDYSNQYNSELNLPDNSNTIKSIRDLRRPREFIFEESLNSICIAGSNLQSENNSFYFLNQEKFVKTILLTINGIQLQDNKEMVRSGSYNQNISFSPNLYKSDVYKILSVQKVSDSKKFMIVKTNYSIAESNCSDSPGNVNLGIYTINESLVSKRIFDYFPIDLVNANSGFFASSDNYIYVIAAKKGNDCLADEKVLLKISNLDGTVQELNLTSMFPILSSPILNNRYHFFDLEILKDSQNKENVYISGIRDQFVSSGDRISKIEIPFLIKISHENPNVNWLKLYHRNESNCVDPLTISNPHIINFKSNFDSKNYISLLFNVDGSYYRGGSMLVRSSSLPLTKDIGRLEIDLETGEPQYFRRFESLETAESYSLVMPDTKFLNIPQISIIKTGTGDTTQFFEIPYYTDK